MNKTMKIILFSVLFLIMLGTTIWASLQQNLFTEFSWNGSEMWFKATLIDFYINQIILWFAVYILEKSILAKLIWLVLFICFGSMGTCAYIIYKIIKNKPILHRGMK